MYSYCLLLCMQEYMGSLISTKFDRMRCVPEYPKFSEEKEGKTKGPTRVKLLICTPKWEQGSPFQIPNFQADLPLLQQNPGTQMQRKPKFPQFLLPAKHSGSVWLTVGISAAKNELGAQTPVAHQNARVLWLCSVPLPAVVNLN